MTVNDVSDLMSEAIYTIIVTCAPLLLISMVVGLAISLFQTITSIQEQTLTFVPKILAVFAAIMILGHFMLNNVVTYMQALWADFSIYIR